MSPVYAGPMDELLNAWNEVKKRLIRKDRVVFCKPREIWWCSIGMNVGSEIYGKGNQFERPVLILKTYNQDMALVAPITTRDRSKDRNAIKVLSRVKMSFVLLSQVRTISTKRLHRKMADLSREEFEMIKTSYKESI